MDHIQKLPFANPELKRLHQLSHVSRAEEPEQSGVTPADFVLRYSEDQPRDEGGRWTGGGGAGGGNKLSKAEVDKHEKTARRLSDDSIDALNDVTPSHVSVSANGEKDLLFEGNGGSHQIGQDVHESLLAAGYQHVGHATVDRGKHGTHTTNYYENTSEDRGNKPSGVAVRIKHAESGSKTAYASGYGYNAKKNSVK